MMFRASQAGDIPRGRTRGTVLLATGSPLARPIARFVRAFGWKGKTFAADGASLKNRITTFDLPAVRASVFVGPSRTDERPCIVIDYSRTSLIAWFVRDEIREIEPGVFLGKAYAFGASVAYFALEAGTQ